ncbi:hypothetical protein [Arthrobacter sp. D2-10]
MSTDASELRKLGMDLGAVASKAAPQIGKSVSKGALNIKNQLRREASGSQHFGHLERVIDYEMVSVPGASAADIGPNKALGGSASLAGIAYFGSSRPGGGTLPDPVKALDAEAPRLESAIADILGKSFS